MKEQTHEILGMIEAIEDYLTEIKEMLQTGDQDDEQ